MPAATKIPTTLSRVKSRTDARHLMRYLWSKAGIDPAEIAKRDHVSVKTVTDSIREMERYESANSEGQLSLAVRGMMISIMPKAEETLIGLLDATNTIQIPNKKTGGVDYVSEPDKITRLEALKVVKGMIDTTQPKAPPVAVNVQQNNQQVATLSSAETTEERFRRLKAKASEHNLLPPVVAGVPEAIDKGFDPDDDDGDDDEDE